MRFGVMIVGHTGCTKTTIYKVLQEVMTSLYNKGSTDARYKPVHTHILNPKSISMGELYGEVDFFSQEWHDGLASNILRTLSSLDTQVSKY